MGPLIKKPYKYTEISLSCMNQLVLGAQPGGKYSIDT